MTNDMTTPQYWAVFDKEDKVISNAFGTEGEAWGDYFGILYADQNRVLHYKSQGFSCKPVVVLTVDEYQKLLSKIPCEHGNLELCKLCNMKYGDVV